MNNNVIMNESFIAYFIMTALPSPKLYKNFQTNMHLFL